jgi:DnaJ family protein C protein 11
VSIGNADGKKQEETEEVRFSTALLHPDRHPDPALKHAADSRFQELNRAFEVLSDTHKRTVYDELGMEGLKTSWEVGARHKTPAEVSESSWRSRVAAIRALLTQLASTVTSRV